MADSTKIPVRSENAGLGAPPARWDEPAGDADVPTRPSWMNAGAIQRPGSRPPQQPTAPPPLAVIPDEGEAINTRRTPDLIDRCIEWLRTTAVAGYGVSLLLHVVVLAVMALWVFPQITESRSITTVVESDVEAPQPFDAMNDVRLEASAGREDIVVPQLTEVIQQDAELNVLEHQFLQDVTAADTQGDGGAGDVGSGGFRLLEPKNAVKAGSFTAWTIPIADPRRFPGAPQAGDSPRPGQDYHIVIQVKIPGNRNAYNISDLSGKVIGTDGYIQIIPAQAFVQDENGRLVLARIGRRLPVEEGVVQILIRVPGAEALVKDTIRVKSKLLKENQTLDLIFGKRSPDN
ncbi:MAG: hypothetical protein AB7U20_02920 [Planctomycetaceae bacterium]